LTATYWRKSRKTPKYTQLSSQPELQQVRPEPSPLDIISRWVFPLFVREKGPGGDSFDRGARLRKLV
jgi:hypothetical protein